MNKLLDLFKIQAFFRCMLWTVCYALMALTLHSYTGAAVILVLAIGAAEVFCTAFEGVYKAYKYIKE